MDEIENFLQIIVIDIIRNQKNFSLHECQLKSPKAGKNQPTFNQKAGRLQQHGARLMKLAKTDTKQSQQKRQHPSPRYVKQRVAQMLKHSEPTS